MIHPPGSFGGTLERFPTAIADPVPVTQGFGFGAGAAAAAAAASASSPTASTGQELKALFANALYICQACGAHKPRDQMHGDNPSQTLICKGCAPHVIGAPVAAAASAPESPGQQFKCKTCRSTKDLGQMREGHADESIACSDCERAGYVPRKCHLCRKQLMARDLRSGVVDGGGVCKLCAEAIEYRRGCVKAEEEKVKEEAAKKAGEKYAFLDCSACHGTMPFRVHIDDTAHCIKCGEIRGDFRMPHTLPGTCDYCGDCDEEHYNYAKTRVGSLCAECVERMFKIGVFQIVEAPSAAAEAAASSGVGTKRKESPAAAAAAQEAKEAKEEDPFAFTPQTGDSCDICEEKDRPSVEDKFGRLTCDSCRRTCTRCDELKDREVPLIATGGCMDRICTDCDDPYKEEDAKWKVIAEQERAKKPMEEQLEIARETALHRRRCRNAREVELACLRKGQPQVYDADFEGVKSLEVLRDLEALYKQQSDAMGPKLARYEERQEREANRKRRAEEQERKAKRARPSSPVPAASAAAQSDDDKCDRCGTHGARKGCTYCR